MAYQNVGKPRMYINIAEFLNSHGYMNTDPLFRTLPVAPRYYETIQNFPFIENFDIDFGAKRFMAVLGIKDQNHPEKIAFGWSDWIDGGIVNTSNQTGGYMIGRVGSFPEYLSFGTVGSIVIGLYYDFPTSPDFSLSLSYEYDGVTEITTKGGSTLTNANYTKPAMWGDRGAWELRSEFGKLSRSGRRIWNISFSYMADDEIFPENLAMMNEGIDGAWGTTLNTLFKDDTLQRAIHLTNGHIPFIFQPDSTNNKVFAIAKFDQKSFNFTQKAPNIYSISLKIREIW